MSAFFEADVPGRLHELDDVVRLPLHRVEILLHTIADRKPVSLPDQPFQAFQTPEEDSLFLRNQLVREVSVVHPVVRFLPDLDDHLAAVEAVRAVVQSGKGPVPESHDPEGQADLLALPELPLDICLVLHRHKALQRPCVRQRIKVHVIIHHQQFADLIGLCEAVGDQFLNAAHRHVCSLKRPQDMPDLALPFAAFSNQHHHDLRPVGWDKGISHELLKSGDVFRIKQFINEFQTHFRFCCAGIVINRKPVHADALLRRKPSVKVKCPVLHVQKIQPPPRLF